ncbi:PqqD family peptide modification chaperone [Rivularia sp. UHCC 0363]|uniref:PqqD family peptide modification chaperone n=1 Tax=Rivularia sp. UHCC 0363 TaxID=3110244 RepID=UPI002B21D729|nr:PqqD family peptide modification chaperone [Rivularia sp. UHCC 0363]MEA5593438.1 PqqD family peptide modification chaperone [Rivularia sp. UHCC 0363]
MVILHFESEFYYTLNAVGSKVWQLLADSENVETILRWMGENPTEAEDALSLAMVKAWEKIQQYAGKVNNYKGWLTLIFAKSYTRKAYDEKTKALHGAYHISVRLMGVLRSLRDVSRSHLLINTYSRSAIVFTN